MAKGMIAKVWIWGVVVMTVAGTLAALITMVMAAYVVDGRSGSRVSLVYDNFFWITIALMLLSGIVAGVGAIFQLVAWIGAVFNANRLAEKRWLHVLLWGGIAGHLVILLTLSSTIKGWGHIAELWPGYLVGGLIGWGVMFSYLIGRPDEMAVQLSQKETQVSLDTLKGKLA